MPWSGSGVYTRAYGSWTADASSGLPISATKFDLEDNDFAAGIQNCLTIDNQNKPNTTLTWAQTMNLTKGTDANVLSIARTGGTNNPALVWSVQDSANTVTARLGTGNIALSLGPGAYAFGNTTDDPTFTFSGAGLISAVVPAGNFAFTANGPAANASAIAFAINSVSQGYIGYAGAANQLVSGSVAGDFLILSNQRILFATGGNGIQALMLASGTFQINDSVGSFFPVGYLGLPTNSQAGNYTTVLSDRAKQIIHNSPSAHTYTIAANASVAYAIGDVIHIVNPPSGGSLTIAINSDTLTLVPTGTTGSRTLLAPGVATAEKIAATAWIIYGSNLS